MEKPFKPLEDFYPEGSLGNFTSIEQVRENPQILVKEIFRLNTPEGIDGDYNFEEFKTEVVSPIKVLEQNGFQKFIPEVQIVWGKNEQGADRGFLITRKVEGNDISDLPNIEPHIVRELDELLAKSLEVATTTFPSNLKIVFPDIFWPTANEPSLSNIMVGKIKDANENHVYLIDLYPSTVEKNFFENINLEKYEADWEKILNDLSQKSEEEYSFPLATTALQNFLSVVEDWKNSVNQHS